MNVTKMMTITVVWHISFDGIWLVRIDLGQQMVMNEMMMVMKIAVTMKMVATKIKMMVKIMIVILMMMILHDPVL